MNIDDLTIGEAKRLAAMFGASTDQPIAANAPAVHDKQPVLACRDKQPVLVCTDKRGVVFGYCDSVDARPLTLTDARMCLYWSSDVGGVFGLADIGPTKSCKISAPVDKVVLEGVTAVFEVDPQAVKAWASAPVQGR